MYLKSRRSANEDIGVRHNTLDIHVPRKQEERQQNVSPRVGCAVREASVASHLQLSHGLVQQELVHIDNGASGTAWQSKH